MADTLVADPFHATPDFAKMFLSPGRDEVMASFNHDKAVASFDSSDDKAMAKASVSLESADEDKAMAASDVPRANVARKREASSILAVECAKRRENFASYEVPSPLPVSCLEVQCDSPADSGIESSKNNSPEHSTETSSADCSDEENRLNSTSDECRVQRPPLWPSLFEDRPPTLYFPAKGEEVSPLPEEKRSLLKWKLSSITPVVIKENVLNANFVLLEADAVDDAWLCLWGKHLKLHMFKSVRRHQKVNHLPGGFHLGRKDRLWQSYRRMLAKHGSADFAFFPDSFLLPQEAKQLRAEWDAEPAWILKPCASARGTGVKVIHKWCQVPKTGHHVVQRYISNPYLINGSKFDLRLYVLVPSIEPLRIYLYEDGLVRFASRKYSLSSKSLQNRFVHLTNYSVNRRSATYAHNHDPALCQGHKWSMKAFWRHMQENGVDVPKIKEAILDIIIKTIISTEGPICRQMKLHAHSAYNCFELFGFDIMLDKELRPWLLEVNISPSLHTRSPLDHAIKSSMVRDMLNIVGFELPDTNTESSRVRNRHRSLQARALTEEERRKHSHFTFRNDESLEILRDLTADDVCCLAESEDERVRAGGFARVFPTPRTRPYGALFAHVRYYNLLLDAFERAHAHDRRAGIDFIRSSYQKLEASKLLTPED